MTHTPGPWETGKGACHTVFSTKRDGQRHKIAECHNGDSLESFANACLIAAAPALLALAKQFASECAECSGTGEDRRSTVEAHIECSDCADIRAVIVKAEGRS